MMLRAIQFGCASLFLLLMGLLHGLYTDRWQTSQVLAEFVAKLHEIPVEAGGWEGTDIEMDKGQFERGHIVGHISRRYRNHAGEEVSVLIVCGPSGPVAVHPPDICYRAIGYEPAGPPKPTSIDLPDAEATFWVGTFHKGIGPDLERLRIYWGWNSGGTWEAPDNARRAYAGKPALYKLYVIERLPRGADAVKGGAASHFLKEFLPHLQTVLQPEKRSAFNRSQHPRFTHLLSQGTETDENEHLLPRFRQPWFLMQVS
jgi:hypothetical protein